MKKYGIFLLFSASILLSASGCSTIADARNSRGQGTTRTYQASFDTVWEVAPKAVNALGLSIAGDNKDEGYILAQKGLTAFSYGENVAVFVEKLDEEQTKVEVVSKKTMATNVFAWNWEQPVLDKITEMLNERK